MFVDALANENHPELSQLPLFSLQHTTDRHRTARHTQDDSRSSLLASFFLSDFHPRRVREVGCGLVPGPYKRKRTAGTRAGLCTRCKGLLGAFLFFPIFCPHSRLPSGVLSVLPSVKTVATRVLLDDPGAALGRPHPVLVLGAFVFASSSFFIFEGGSSFTGVVTCKTRLSCVIGALLPSTVEGAADEYTISSGSRVSDPGRAEWGGMRETLCRLL